MKYWLTETKKLDVPSERWKVPGNSLSQVSSPYMTRLRAHSLFHLSFICASHVSCDASVEVVSDSAKLRITSRKEGIDPVVIALILGMVIVGEVAWAVKGIADPLEIRLGSISYWTTYPARVSLPLCESKTRKLWIDKITAIVSIGLSLTGIAYLRSASTTMNTTLLKGASGGVGHDNPSYLAKPDRKGL